MVAIAKAGGIIVPINNRLALPEILYILEDANPFAIIYTPDSRPVIAQTHISPKIIKIISGSPIEGVDKEKSKQTELISHNKKNQYKIIPLFV